MSDWDERGSHVLTVVPDENGGYDEPGPNDPPLDPVDGTCSCGWRKAACDPAALADDFMSHVGEIEPHDYTRDYSEVRPTY